MTREIKFRGLHLDGSGWAYGYYTVESDIHYIEIPEVSCNFNAFEVKSETVGQYTGLKDKNGVEIYEGDILANPKIEMGTVVWYNSGFSLECKRRNGQIFYIPLDFGFLGNKHIAGNIHQNP